MKSVLAARILIAVAGVVLLLLHINTADSHKLLQLQSDATISSNTRHYCSTLQQHST
jgi:hypothetical protein